ncbi:acyl-CoA thioesterase [Pedobacter cryoconitis]|uniref:Acyl-CoA thioester hydrolase/thioesterase-3 n=1 Tax=Pedobacter cryoconitis TaxID=188932 RepID=A0A7X0J3Z7_9SPHI|nr:acyl-CoA thioesterase [Pedobacter cryoconitis]MBB6499377.1 acyl-CoA thioester hydrolase/thioesterase-3 [Pedobacter cryoconitis]
MEKTEYSIFETALKVRPDDIDMFNHVHNSKYFDYVLAARYDQMEQFYKMPMEEFLKSGFGWVVRTAHVDYKRPLILGDQLKIRTGILTINDKGCRVQFEIENTRTGKIASDGYFDYVLIDTTTGKGCKVSEEMIKAYSI